MDKDRRANSQTYIMDELEKSHEFKKDKKLERRKTDARKSKKN